jgi:transposase InsO family protein
VLVELSVMEQRYRAVLEVTQARIPVNEVAERYGVSRQTVHAWVKRYAAEGIGGLVDRSCRPEHIPIHIDPEVEAAICEMRRKHSRYGPIMIRYWLERDGVFPLPSRTTIYRVLVRNHLIVPVPRKRRRDSYIPWERAISMELWQHDFISGVFLANGAECKVVTGIDDHSRYCVLAKVVRRATGRQVSLAFVQALSTYGLPDEVLSDNGTQFAGRLLKPEHRAEVLFERICRENDIVQRFTKVASPTTMGKIERLHLTMRLELLDGHPPFERIEALQAAFDAWRCEYNETRPHQSLDMGTPASLFVPRPETVAELVLPPELSVVHGEARQVITVAEEPERFVDEPTLAPEDIKAVELSRLVPPSGNLSISEQQVWLGPKMVGQKIEIWADTVSVHISMEGQHLKTVPSRLSINSLHRLVREGATVAGPPPRGPAATGLRAADATLELERSVNGVGLVALGGKQFVVGIALAGQRVRIRLEGDIGHVISSGVVVRSFACALEPSKRQRLQGARLPDSTPLPSTEPIVVGRRVCATGVITVGGQRVVMGRAHRRKTVEVLVEQRYLRITHQGATIKVVARNTPREVNRFKATRGGYVS